MFHCKTLINVSVHLDKCSLVQKEIIGLLAGLRLILLKLIESLWGFFKQLKKHQARCLGHRFSKVGSEDKTPSQVCACFVILLQW